MLSHPRILTLTSHWTSKPYQPKFNKFGKFSPETDPFTVAKAATTSTVMLHGAASDAPRLATMHCIETLGAMFWGNDCNFGYAMWIKNMAKHMFVWRMTRFEASIAPWPAEWDAGKTCERICNNIFGYWQTRWGSFLLNPVTEKSVFSEHHYLLICYNMIPLFFHD